MEKLQEANILIVDDEDEIAQIVTETLTADGFTQLRSAGTVRAALAMARELVPDIFILDVMLPDGSGFDLYTRLREFTMAPILFLSARDEDAARLNGLGLGADDYVTKPFLPQELLLRVKAVLNRAYQLSRPATPGKIHLGRITIDMGTCEITGGQTVKSLTAKEYAIIETLYGSRGKIVTIDALCEALWPDGNYGYENTLMVHLRRLREKIEADPSHPQYLLTIRGIGYRLIIQENPHV